MQFKYLQKVKRMAAISFAVPAHTLGVIQEEHQQGEYNYSDVQPKIKRSRDLFSGKGSINARSIFNISISIYMGLET